MNLRLHFIVSCALIIGLTSADKVDSFRKDDIYLEDEDLEGSGIGNREFNKDDLESSGSGIGDDDEDSSGSGEEPIEATTLPKETTTFTTKPKPQPPEYPPQYPPQYPPDTHHGERPRPEDSISMDPKHHDRTASFFAQPGILAAVIGGCVVGLLCAILVVMFIVYRMRKKDEGSYPLDEPKRSPTSHSYMKNSQREFYA